MRKINYSIECDPETFNLRADCKVRLEDGNVFTLFTRTVDDDEFMYKGSRFRIDEIQKIKEVNFFLGQQNLTPLTLEEAKFMLNWNSVPDPKTTDELQRLSGFVVEKNIKYLD